ncbi:MAG: hypothetical protein K8R48_09405 [Alphaproteobacteria bacterium]|nr:hypothetical protein [Alphaproteobacteria bacterium]
MSIFSDEQKSKLRYVWDFAALDLPVPDKLEGDDKIEWNSYSKYLSPSDKIRKFGQALDQLLAVASNMTGPGSPSEADLTKFYAKWEASMILGSHVGTAFNHQTEKLRYDHFKSDIDYSLFWLVEFLKNVNSADTKTWQDRHQKYLTMSDSIHDNVSKYYSAQNKSNGPKI